MRARCCWTSNWSAGTTPIRRGSIPPRSSIGNGRSDPLPNLGINGAGCGARWLRGLGTRMSAWRPVPPAAIRHAFFRQRYRENATPTGTTMSQDLESVAGALVADGKGILAADETVPTLTKRFDTLGIRSTEQSRRTYREMLFTAPGVAEFISGVIMQDETIRQKSSGGTPVAEALS